MQRFALALILAVAAPAAARAEMQELMLPVVVNGYASGPLRYQTTFRIVNLSAVPAEVTLEAYQNDGTATRILEMFPVPRRKNARAETARTGRSRHLLVLLAV